MRQEHNLLIPNQTRVHLRFILIDVKATRVDFSRVDGGDKGAFVNDRTTGRVDDYDAGFHFRELGIGNQMVGGALSAR